MLGTFVEIRVVGLPSPQAKAAIDAAFRQVARVHALMSPHEPTSDVARLNRAPLRRAIRVHAWTRRVLAAAAKLSRESGGEFDITAPANAGGDWRDIELLPNRRIRRRCRVQIDLGGIAKGFAVDRAVATLRARGASAGAVNAGGDLRVFGGKLERVSVRHPANPSIVLPLLDLTEGAVATSANYLDPRGAGRLRRPRGRRLWVGQGSVSVCAASAMVADALTKIVAAIGPYRARPLLRQYAAAAVVLTRRGAVIRTEEGCRAA